MKEKLIKVIFTIFIITLTLCVVTNCYAAYTPLSQDNLITAFSNIKDESGSALNFDVSDDTISITSDSQTYNIKYNVSDNTFTSEFNLADDAYKVKSQMISVLYGYIAASNVQGKSVEDSTKYIVQEINRMEEYVRSKLIDEGATSTNSTLTPEDINVKDLFSSNLMINMLAALVFHSNGNMNYSDNNTFSLNVEKTESNDVKATITILTNDFISSSSTSKSMGFNFSSLVNEHSSDSNSNSNSNSNSGSTKVSSGSERSTEKTDTKKDETISKEEKIPQTGRSNTVSTVIAVTIMASLILLVGMLAFDIKKNHK